MNRRSSDRDSWEKWWESLPQAKRKDGYSYIDDEKWPRVVRACIWIALIIGGWALLLWVARAAALLWV